jgi:hypothetical protein
LRTTTIEKIAKNIYNKIQNVSFKEFSEILSKITGPYFKDILATGEKLPVSVIPRQ